jgi:hypothetical protein
MSPRSCFTILVVGALIALAADWLINHMPTPTPPPSPVHIQSLPLSSPVSAAPANQAAALTAVTTAAPGVRSAIATRQPGPAPTGRSTRSCSRDPQTEAILSRRDPAVLRSLV